MSAIGQGSTQTTEIMVNISAPQLEMSAIEEKSLIRGEF